MTLPEHNVYGNFADMDHALMSGIVAGALITSRGVIDTVEVQTDSGGDYRPEIHVTRQGRKYVINVEPLHDSYT